MASKKFLAMFPESAHGVKADGYQKFRHSWILIKRNRPVVPCPENTPMPNRKQSKHLRAKLFSIYLRPWTLWPEECDCDVPYITDLDLTVAQYQSQCQVRDPEEQVTRDIRAAWKEYLMHRIPAPFTAQVVNFLRAAYAEGLNQDLDVDSGRETKLDAVTCQITSKDIDEILSKGQQEIRHLNIGFRASRFLNCIYI